jgi:hypothetical protein
VTKLERQHLAAVADMGCIVCEDLGFPGSPAEIHHQLGQGRDNFKVMPLCPTHHRHGGYGVAVHDGTKIWEEVYGTQESLVKRVNKQVGENGDS